MHQEGGLETWGHLAKFTPRPDVDLIWVSVRDEDLYFKHRNIDGTRWANQAFDLARDPHEEHDIFDASDPRHREMAGALRHYKATLVESSRSSVQQQEDRMPLPSEQEEALRALGYIE